MLELSLEARACDRLETFCEQVVPAVRRLVPCDWYGYNEVDLERRTTVAITDAPMPAGLERRFIELVDQHPLVGLQKAGDLRPYLLSDFLTARQFHRLELYQEIYRLLGTEDQIAFGLPGEVIVAIVLSRPRRTFSERDGQLLEILRPHLSQAYEELRRREHTATLVRALEAGLEDRHAGVLAIDAQARITHAAGSARQLLASYFPQEPASGSRLPAIVQAWAQSKQAETELVIAGLGGRLRVRRHGSESRRPRTLVLVETRSGAPSTDSLIALGLTPRQADVLRLLAHGMKTERIASELSISPTTVSKHLEHIYERLGVSSRGEAIAWLRELQL